METRTASFKPTWIFSRAYLRQNLPHQTNITFIECHRHIQALRALGEDVNGYGRMLIPKILCAFPPEICQRWIVHVKRQDLSGGDILKLMEFLGGEVDGVLTAQKICG